jgi:hypothetical protein
MLPCSKPGELYAIDTDSVNAGIPYADSFYISTHYCISRIADNETCLAVYAQVKYTKSVWGLVKSKYTNVNILKLAYNVITWDQNIVLFHLHVLKLLKVSIKNSHRQRC